MKRIKSIKSITADIIRKNENIITKFYQKKIHLRWITIEDVIHIYKMIANKMNAPFEIFSDDLIIDALYNPIKDIGNYESSNGIFIRICNCVYLIGHTVSTCNVPLMIITFLTLCEINNISIKPITDKWVDVFINAYNKKIHPEAFTQMLTDLTSIPFITEDA